MKKFLILPILVATLLSGCGGDESTPSSKVNSDIYTEVGTYPIVKEGHTVSFSAFAPLRPSVTSYDPEINYFSKYMEEMTGTNVDFVEATNADAQQKFNIMMTGGDYTDVILIGVGLPELALYGQQGIFLPLNDLIDQHGPNIKKALEAHPEVFDAWTTERRNFLFYSSNW